MKNIVSAFVLTLLLTIASTAQGNPDPRAVSPSTAASPGAGRAQFEYAVVIDYYSTSKGKSYSEILYSDGRSEDTSSMNKATILGKLGSQGWELVTTSSVQNADSYTYFEKSWLYLRRAK